MATWPDPYGVLEVSPNASMDEIRAAYRQGMGAQHPDHGGADDVLAHGEIVGATEAWRRLSSETCGSHQDARRIGGRLRGRRPRAGPRQSRPRRTHTADAATRSGGRSRRADDMDGVFVATAFSTIGLSHNREEPTMTARQPPWRAGKRFRGGDADAGRERFGAVDVRVRLALREEVRSVATVA